MTDEQRKVVEENHNLIYSFLKRYGLSIEEYYDLAAIGLCEAVVRYDESRGWSLTTYAYERMFYETFHEIRSHRRDKAIPVDKLVYYHAITLDGDDSGDAVEFLDVIASDIDVVNEAALNVVLDKIRSNLNKKELLIFDMSILGYTQTEIGKVVGCHQTDVSKIMKKIRRKFGWLNC